MVPKNCSKATGMQQLVDYLQMDMKDTIAFGNSLNDLPMMQAANITVGWEMALPTPLCDIHHKRY